MNCNESQNYMMKFFDKDLNDIEEAQLKQHLKTCKKCSEDFLSLKEIFLEIENSPDIDPPEDFEVEVIKRIQNEAEMYKKDTGENEYVYNVLTVTVSFIFVILFGGLFWDMLKQPGDIILQANTLMSAVKQFISAAISIGKGITITVVELTSSLYKTYYYAYIALGVLLVISQRILITMYKGRNGGAHE